MPNLHCAVEGPVKKTTSNSKIICMAIIHPYATNFWRTTMTTNNNNIHKNDISTSKGRGCALTCVQIQNLHISTLTCQGQKYVNLGLCWVWVCIHMWFGEAGRHIVATTANLCGGTNATSACYVNFCGTPVHEKSWPFLNAVLSEHQHRCDQCTMG